MTRLVALTLALTIAFAVSAPLVLVRAQQNEVTAEDVVAALEGAYGVHPGERRNHTKGTCALGAFVGIFGGGQVLSIGPVLGHPRAGGGALLAGWRRPRGFRCREEPAGHGVGVQTAEWQPPAHDHDQHANVLRRDATYAPRQDASAESGTSDG